MKIEPAVTRKIANLARIAVREEEIENLSKELSKILTFMDKLNELNTDAVEPLIYLNADTNRWRNDELVNTITTETALKNAPERKGNYFIVPKIIEK